MVPERGDAALPDSACLTPLSSEAAPQIHRTWVELLSSWSCGRAVYLLCFWLFASAVVGGRRERESMSAIRAERDSDRYGGLGAWEDHRI